ncbi:hypothetical protein [Moraxella oblonga]|uniref:hypothetical protein n=1 Tax=Moraxella oblonga TaxID=200413 RepID=UPI0014703BDE|nr:hypothetical protein [Moraxella oblonga]
MSVKNGNPVQFTNNGEVVLTLTEEIKQPSYAKGDFDYDLERMKQAVEAPYVVMPKFDNDDDFFAWVENLTDDDFISEKV